MTVAELIARLQEFPPDAAVYVMGGPDCDTPGEPTPAYGDWGNPRDPDRGVYL